MIRLFNIYVPARLLILVITEPLIICGSFLLAVVFCLGHDSLVVLNYQYGVYKVLAVTALTVVGFDLFDLYDLERGSLQEEIHFRLFVALGLLCCFLAGIGYAFPQLLLGQNSLTVGVIILTIALSGWRLFYGWLLRQHYFRERVYVLGSGAWADQIVEILRARPELGMEVVGWMGAIRSDLRSNQTAGCNLLSAVHKSRARRVIVAIRDRRGAMPTQELLELSLSGVKVEDATTIYQKVSGKIDVDSLNPSLLIFGKGLKLSPAFMFARRVISVIASLILLVLFVPAMPFVAIAIKLTSAGPVLYRQRRTGLKGKVFVLRKFRTMQFDAEDSTGPAWAQEDDPRITPLGHWLRKTRLDEIPQLWNVFCGDMDFVGPRPERPEFEEELARKIPYYGIRHVIRPGITGWAQICYEYGASIEESKEKLKYDLYYIKNLGLGLDLFIILRTLKIVLLGRGAR
jgi:sugar transferase (PEP-CTERM system associated)